MTRVAVVGLGQLAREVHLPLLATVSRLDVIAIADPSGDAIERCHPLAPRARTYTSLDELLAASEIDAVLVASPTAEHAAQARRTLAAGKALYLEKPLAATLDEGLGLMDAASLSPAAMMGFNYRFNPLITRARNQIARNPGGIQKACCQFSIPPRPLPEWKQKRATGGGVLLDLASHHFDLLRYLLSAEVVSVNARIWSERTESDCCELELNFDNGVKADGLYSFCRVERDSIELSGARKSIVIDRYAPLRFPLRPFGEFVAYQMERRRSPWKEVSFRRSLEAWANSLEQRTAPPVTLSDGLQSLRIVAAAEESARLGQSVSLLNASAP